MFTRKNIEPDEKLDAMVGKLIYRKGYELLAEYEVEVKAFWTDQLNKDNISEVKTATPGERYSMECDVVILLSVKEMENWSDKDIESVIAIQMLQIDPVFVGRDQIPKINIRKDYYRVYPEIVNYYGKGARVYQALFNEIKMNYDKSPKYDDDEKYERMGDRMKRINMKRKIR